MVEVVLLFLLVRHLRSAAAAKGHSEWWAGIAVPLWIVGEVSGMVIAVLAGAEDLLVLIVPGILGAAMGAAIAAAVVHQMLPDRRVNGRVPDLDEGRVDPDEAARNPFAGPSA